MSYDDQSLEDASLSARGYRCGTCGDLCGAVCYSCEEDEEPGLFQETQLPETIEFDPEDRLWTSTLYIGGPS